MFQHGNFWLLPRVLVMVRKTKIPQDYQPSEKVRIYCNQKWGLPFLADCFVAAFREHFQASGTRHRDWDRALQNWIRRASPSGEFYNITYWEKQCEAARKLHQPSPLFLNSRSDNRTHTEMEGHGVDNRNWQPTDTGRQTLKHIFRDILKND